SPFDEAHGRRGRLICEDSEGNGDFVETGLCGDGIVWRRDCVETGLCGDGFCGGRASPPVQADCVGTSARVVARTEIGFIGYSRGTFGMMAAACRVCQLPK